MIASLLPLIDKQDHKQGCHAKINAAQVVRDQLSGDAAERGGCKPVETAVYRHPKHEWLPIRILFVHRAVQRVGFIRHGADHIVLAFPHPVKVFNKGQAVKGLSAVHQKRGQSYGDQTRSARQEGHQDELKSAGIDCEAGEQRIIPRETRIFHQHAVGQPDEEVTAHDRQSFDKCFPANPF